MTIKTEKDNEAMNLYSLPIEIGKKLFGNSNMGNFNYGLIQENWQEYSEMFSQEMNKLIEFDENYFKNMTNLWNQFTNTINSGFVKLNGFEKENYQKLYETLFTEFEELNRNYNSIMENQLKGESKLLNIYEQLLLKLGFGEKNVQQIIEFHKITMDYYTKMWNNAMGIFKKSVTNIDTSEYLEHLQKFTEIWREDYMKMIQRVTEPSILHNWNEQYQDQNQSFLKMIQQLFTNYLKNYDWNYWNNLNSGHTNVQDLKEKIDELSKELENYKKHSRSKKGN